MRIGVLSDTHGHVANTKQAAAILATAGVERLIHCGDVGSDAIPSLMPLPTHFVYGNVDRDNRDLGSAIELAGHKIHGDVGKVIWAKRRIAFLHGDDEKRFEETVALREFDLICFGHTHRYELSRHGNSLLLNSGAVYRAKPHSVAIVDLATMLVERIDF